MNYEICEAPQIIEDNLDTSFGGTIFNHYNNPQDFMKDVLSADTKGLSGSYVKNLKEAKEKYAKIDTYNLEYDKLYQQIALEVRDKLIGRGFTTRMLYGTTEFTSHKTGVMSKQRALMGKKDCYYLNPQMSDGKLFHDLYINLSYSWMESDEKIKKNAYKLYALTKELGKLIAMRVIVVNHVGTDIPTCYSYILKQFGRPINPTEFLFFLSDSKRTLGWATYGLLNGGSSSDSAVGRPTGTVSIADFNLDKEIDDLWEFFKTHREI